MLENLNDLLGEAEKYFVNDLRESYWSELTEEDKLGALKLALLDVKSILNICNRNCDFDDKLIVAAIFEQAIHLVIQRTLMQQDKQLTHQSIDGVGSESYSLNDSKKDYYLKERLSGRTVSLLAMPDIGKIVRISR